MKESVGLPRTVTLFRHVDDGDGLALLARAVARHGDEAYLAVRNGGKDGVRLLRRLDAAAGAGELLGLVLVDQLRGLLDQADDVAHLEDAARHALGVEGVEAGELLAGADELDRKSVV